MSAPGTESMKFRQKLSTSKGSSTIRLETLIFYVTRRRVLYKWRHICRNSLVIICNSEHGNVGQRNGKQLLQWWYSMANIKTCKSCIAHFFCASCRHLRDINIWHIWPWKSRSRSLGVNFEMEFVGNGKYPNHRSRSVNFCASSHHLEIITFYILPSKSRSRSKSTNFEMHLSMANIQILKRIPNIFALALTVPEILTLYYFPLKSLSKSWSTIFAMTSFVSECQNLRKLNLTISNI